MKFLSPVVWSEGMHLAQHHFQAQSRYFEELTTFGLRSVFYAAYGVAACELDADALRNGTVSITHARGIMPDGLGFHFPEDPPPAPLDIGDSFSPVQDSHLVLLAVPPYRQGQPNCLLDGTGDRRTSRFIAITQPVPDEVTGSDEKPVALGRKNFRLMLDNEEQGDLVTLPLARVRRDGRGNFVYDPDYIPPCVQIGGSRRLLEMIARLVDRLDAKSDAMLLERQSSAKPLAEYAASEVANFWLTHAVNAARAPLRHMLQTRAAHPERLFIEMSRLAGALCTFSLDSHPRDLPAYDHDDAERSFNALERHIDRMLEVIIPHNTIKVPLAQAEPYFHTGAVADGRCFGPGAQWYLGVRSSAGRAKLAADVPQLIKLCSAEHIVRLVKEGLAGLVLEHEASPASELAPRPGWQYFRVQTAGPCWALLSKTTNAGVYVPGALGDVELELTIVLRS